MTPVTWSSHDSWIMIHASWVMFYEWIRMVIIWNLKMTISWPDEHLIYVEWKSLRPYYHHLLRHWLWIFLNLNHCKILQNFDRPKFHNFWIFNLYQIPSDLGPFFLIRTGSESVFGVTRLESFWKFEIFIFFHFVVFEIEWSLVIESKENPIRIILVSHVTLCVTFLNCF